MVGFSEDQPDKAAKTVLSFKVSPLMGGPAFIARLIPVHSLDHNMIFDQIQQLLKIIHDCSGFVYLVMTDNLRANQSLFQKMHDFYGSKSLWSVNHPINNEEFEELFVLYDPTHLLKNIRNNWVTEKTRTLKFTCPVTGRNVVAKWSDLVAIYNEEMSSFIKHTRINYASLYPTNFEKQNVALVLKIFNEKTVAALKLRKCDDTALFFEHVTKMWNMLNIKTPHDGTKLNNDDRYPFTSEDDCRFDYLHNIARSFKLMDASQSRYRITALTADTSNALHMTLNLVAVAQWLSASNIFRQLC